MQHGRTRQSLLVQCISLFLADRTNGHAIGTVLRPSVVVCLYGMYCG